MNQSRLVLGLIVATAGSVGLAGCGPADPGTSDGTGGTGGMNGGSGGGTGSGGNSGSGGVGTTGSGGSGSGGSTVGSGGAGTGSGGSAASGGSGTGGGGQSSGGANATGGGGGGAKATGGSGPGGNSGTGGATSSGGAGGSVGAVPLDSSLMSRCTGSSPIICTIPVPNNGNYTVTVELGSATAASTSRIQAELYRIVIPEVTLAAGTYSQQTFSVNVRAEDHDGYEAPGKELNLRIDGASPALHGLGYAAAPTIPTLFLAGDSTVCDWDPVYAAANVGPLERGWAQELSQFFKPGIAVANYADSGETASGFYGKFWGPAKAALREGDYVFVQFGHNDQKTETTSNFKTAMMKYITDARNAKATPVLLTPPGRKGASTGDTGFAGFDQATRELATSANVLLVDLTKLSIDYYKTVPDKSVLFATSSEGTHFSEIGATALSKLVTADLKLGTLALKDFIK